MPSYTPSGQGLTQWCDDCGALVLDVEKHDQWHEELDEQITRAGGRYA